MGGFTFDVGVGIPVDLVGWAMQLLPAACAIALERSTERRSRGDYLIALIVYPISCVMMIFVAGAFAMAAGYEDQQNASFFVGYRDPILLTPIFLAALAIEALFRFLVARLIVRRLRDGGIGKRWAYLILIPFIDFLVLIGLLFYPPSQATADAAETTLPQA
jgi:uncharacterized membrane protein YhaH (DUF805 family)